MNIRKAAAAITTVLVLDGLAHLYWATGAMWPATDARTLSLAVLGAPDVPFTAPLLVPLALALFAMAGIVQLRVRRGPVWYLQAPTLALAAILLVQVLIRLAWIFTPALGSPFDELNLLVYTPSCLVLGVAAALLARDGASPQRAWRRRITIGLPLLLTSVMIFAAYGYAPAPATDYRPSGHALYVETPLARFHYEVAGQGEPVVLLSPGASWTRAWRDQMTALSATHRVYVVDLPGQGFTELHDREFRFNLDGMTRAIGIFLDAAHVEHVTLGGHSWSGGWALAYAQQHPERVSKLILVSASGLAERDVWSWELLKLPMVGELFTNLGYADRDMVAKGVRAIFEHDDLVTDEIIDAMWKPNTLPDNLRANWELERGLDWRQTHAGLGQTKQPTLIIWAKQDAILPVAQAHRFHQSIPDSQLNILDGCGHAITLDCAPQVNELMEDFLRAQ